MEKALLQFVSSSINNGVAVFIEWRFFATHVSINTFVVMILGSLPNFLASLAAGIIFIPFSVRKLSVADGRLLVYLFSAVCLVLLIQEEISPFIFGSRINDVNDMITSCIGTFCSVIIYEFAFIRTDRVKA